MNLTGRETIYTDELYIDDTNIVKILNDSLPIHGRNRASIDYLYNYYKGKQPILSREKKVRPEICNKIVENRANEIVSFKVGYLTGEPIQYVGKDSDEDISLAISELNDMMLSENKPTQDKEIVEWQMICGTAYRLVLPDIAEELDDAPFEIYTLDPRNTFVIYSSAIGNKPLLGVTYVVDKNRNITYSIYSKNHFWKIKGGSIIESAKQYLGIVPIFEYPANTAKLGAFEIVLPLLDAINTLASNRLDGVEQAVQSFLKFVNCDISDEKFKELRDMGAIKINSTEGRTADVQLIQQELNQSQTQTLVDDIYQTVLTITGVPNRNGGTSTSDTGTAVLLRDGWSLAEARAKDSELMFKKSENEMLKLVLRICRDSDVIPQIKALRPRDIGMQFTRRNYENIANKSQVLCAMLQNEKIHPRLAFEHCGMFTDPEEAYRASMEYYNQKQADELVALMALNVNNDENDEL